MSTMKTESLRTSLRALVGLGLVLSGAAGCGNLTAGGFGEAVVVVSGDDPAPTPALVSSDAGLVSPQSSFLAGPAATDGVDDTPEGQLEAELLVYLVGEDGALWALNDDVLEVRVDLKGVEQDETLPRQLPAQVYTELRLVFLEIEVQVDAGLIINGTPVTGIIDIEIEDSLTVNRALALDIGPEDRAEIFVDLNAADWLLAVDPVTLLVDPTVFAELITVTVR